MPQPQYPNEAFAAQYLDYTTRTLDRFEFFGADPRGIPRQHGFGAGYVPLTLNRRDQESGTVSAGSRADQALTGYRRALVRGVAGSGKSTLLRWLGVRAAGHPADGDGEATLPFVLELGHYAGGQLPELADLVPARLRPAMPDEQWLHRMLADGRVLLLLDGLDEVRPRERVHVEDWVDEHLAVHPATRCIVTTRPSAVTEQWWADREFHRFDLLPMSRHSIEEYVQGWHTFAQQDYPADNDAGTAARESLARCERELLSTLPNRPALRGMSANPLLCGLLCALHLERGEHLPESRKQVYDAAVELLVVRWPHLRRRRRAMAEDGAKAGNDSVELRLSSEELLKLLQRLAFSLVTNRELVLEPETARRRVEAFMVGLRGGDEDPGRVLQYLAEDSGLLRELPDGPLQFVHRTFRDHLAAKEVVDEANLNLMLDNADKPHWHDVVVMSGAHARPAERTWILRELLERGRSDAEHRDTLYLLAAAILEQSAVLPQDPQAPDVREVVHDAMSALIPPRTLLAADQLAQAGPFVLDLLPGPAQLTGHQAARVVRTAAVIAAQSNPPGALEKILQFTSTPDQQVLTQLLEIWGRYGEYEDYARTVLAEVDFSRFEVDLQGRQRIDCIGYLDSITTLRLRNNVPRLGPLGDLPRLRRLTLDNNAMTNLEPLALCRSLQIVQLTLCASMVGTRPVDLSPLAALNLRKLGVSGVTTMVDLRTLVGTPLFGLALGGGALRGSPTLPPGLHVDHLTLEGTPGVTGLAEVRGLRSVTMNGVPTGDELAQLRALPELRRLALRRVPDGAPVPTLPGVDVVTIRCA